MTARSLPRIAIALLLLSLVSCGASTDDADDRSFDPKTGERSAEDRDASTARAGAAGEADSMGSGSVALDGEHRLTSREGAFSITLPAGFEYPTESVSDMGKDVKLHKFVASNGRSEAVMISYTIVPEWFFKSGDTTGILDLLRDGDVIGAAITKEREMRIGGYPGRSYFWDHRDKEGPHFGRSVHYLVPPRVYQITYLSTSAMKMVDTPENAKFFDSFALIPDGTK